MKWKNHFVCQIKFRKEKNNSNFVVELFFFCTFGKVFELSEKLSPDTWPDLPVYDFQISDPLKSGCSDPYLIHFDPTTAGWCALFVFNLVRRGQRFSFSSLTAIMWVGGWRPDVSMTKWLFFITGRPSPSHSTATFLPFRVNLFFRLPLINVVEIRATKLTSLRYSRFFTPTFFRAVKKSCLKIGQHLIEL